MYIIGKWKSQITVRWWECDWVEREFAWEISWPWSRFAPAYGRAGGRNNRKRKERWWVVVIVIQSCVPGVAYGCTRIIRKKGTKSEKCSLMLVQRRESAIREGSVKRRGREPMARRLDRAVGGSSTPGGRGLHGARAAEPAAPSARVGAGGGRRGGRGGPTPTTVHFPRALGTLAAVCARGTTRRPPRFSPARTCSFSASLSCSSFFLSYLFLRLVSAIACWLARTRVRSVARRKSRSLRLSFVAARKMLVLSQLTIAVNYAGKKLLRGRSGPERERERKREV